MAHNSRPRRPWEEGSEALSPAESSTGVASEIISAPIGPTSSLQDIQRRPSNEASAQQDPRPLQSRRTVHSSHRQTSSLDSLIGQNADNIMGLNQQFFEFQPLSSSSKRRRVDDQGARSRERLISGAFHEAFTARSDQPSITPGRCCSASCTGSQCVSLRSLSSKLNSQIAHHEMLVHGSNADTHRAIETGLSSLPLSTLLEAICNRLTNSNISLKTLLDSNAPKAGSSIPRPPSPQPPDRRDSQSTQNPPDPSSQPPTSADKTSPTVLPSARARLHSSTAHPPPSPVSLHITIPPPAHSLTSIPASPSSSNLPSTTFPSLTLPPSSLLPSSSAPPIPTSSAIHSSTHSSVAQSAISHHSATSHHSAAAHAAVIDDLRHQLSVQTLHYTTLTKEYETLFAKLERQRVKCDTFEKKFKVSDAEIIALSTDKERLEDRIEGLQRDMRMLESQRDEARRVGEESKSQWMRIVDMAGKLHPGAEGSASVTGGMIGSVGETEWMAEKARLTRRVRQLESMLAIKHDGADVGEADLKVYSPGTQSRVSRLEEELDTVRARNGRLESGLLAAKQAALTLAAHGQTVGTVLSRALGES
ncbi:hypothetical protein BT63DRAFT_410382 [Microthyrium microscopicum]|uniref:Uncharacterized protein n=1 Tax=Microthyrium microscopicum TaxID=703497 RepID=A0A6A6UNS5_9PEZI|nr:hypothetical protein BT63DRAFT_410382 [Microthyrium microscopicum]